MSDVKIIDKADIIYVSQQSKKDFMERIRMYGLTVLPEYQEKWWKYS